jgi:hypothetical protein
MRKIIKFGFRQNIFGKQILQVLAGKRKFLSCRGDFVIAYNWRDATREEADYLNCKIKEINNNVE